MRKNTEEHQHASLNLIVIIALLVFKKNFVEVLI